MTKRRNGWWKFDAVLLDAPRDGFKALTGTAASRIVAAKFGPDEQAWAAPDALKSVREKLLAAAGSARRAE